MNTAIERLRSDDGMSTAEYAVGTCGAIGLAGLLVKVITSPEILTLIKDLILNFLKTFVPDLG